MFSGVRWAHQPDGACIKFCIGRSGPASKHLSASSFFVHKCKVGRTVVCSHFPNSATSLQKCRPCFNPLQKNNPQVRSPKDKKPSKNFRGQIRNAKGRKIEGKYRKPFGAQCRKIRKPQIETTLGSISSRINSPWLLLGTAFYFAWSLILSLTFCCGNIDPNKKLLVSRCRS